MRFGRKWAFREPYGDPPFVKRFEDRDGVVGRSFFADLAEQIGGSFTIQPDGEGILRSVDDLGGGDFRPQDLHPLVRQVYNSTSAMEFLAERMDFTYHGWLIHFLYKKLIGERMRQLNAPMDEGFLPRVMKSRIGFLDEDGDGQPEHRIWIRTFDDTGDIFYAGAVSRHEARENGRRQVTLDVVLPLFHSNLTAVFQPVNRPGGGLSLKTRTRDGIHTGLYLVFPGGERFSMMPAWGVHEEIRVEPILGRDGRTVIRGTHFNWWWFLPMYTLHYTLRPAGG